MSRSNISVLPRRSWHCRAGVCTENSVRVASVTESLKVGDQGRADILLPGVLRLLVHLVCLSVPAHPTAEWIARQITEAFRWNEADRARLNAPSSVNASGAISLRFRSTVITA